MAKIKKILYNGMYILPETVTDAVLDNNMERTLTEILDDKLSATEDDTAQGKITLAGGAVADHLQSTTYTSGIGGKGYEIKVEDKSQLTIDKAVIRDDAQIGGDAAISGSASVGGQLTTDNITSSDYNAEFTGFTLKNTDDGSYLEVAKLNVLKKAVFRVLDIKELDHIGGANVISPASCKMASVTTEANAYKCYFNATDGDKTIRNEWKVGDQALCHAFNLSTPRYFWRLVTAVSAEPTNGYHWVALSITDCDTDSDVPMAEDTIVCFGNRTDKDRQSVIIMDSEGTSAPYLRQLKGINSYTISDANIVTQLSPTKNIIRGEQIELTTSSGNKGVQQLANEALASAKGYTDTKATDVKAYADGVLSSANSYAESKANGALSSAKSYADGVGTSTLTSAKGYADSVGTNASNTAKSYADGLFADAESYTQEREAYLQTQITANDEEIALRATKVEVQTVSDNVGELATRVTGAEASIKTNADNIALKAAKTEVDTIKTDLGNVTSRVSTAEAAIQVNADNISQRVTKTEYDSGITDANLLATAISKGVMMYNDPTFKRGVNGVMRYNGDYSTVTREEDSTAPNDSGYVLTISKNPNTTTGSILGFCWGVMTRANLVLVCRIVAKIPVGSKLFWASNPYGSGGSQKWLTSIDGTGDWCEYVHYLKCGSTGAFNTTAYFYLDNHNDDTTFQLAYATVIDATSAEQYPTLTQYNTAITQLSDSINLKASKTELQTVQTATDTASLLATALSKGVNLRPDCTFKEGYNQIYQYSNATKERMQEVAAPNDSGFVIKISKSTGTSVSYGFTPTVRSIMGRKYIIRFIAKIADGYKIYFTSYNGNGTAAIEKWLTPNIGTGDWEEYIYYIQCGAEGTSNENAYFWISDSSSAAPPFYIAYLAYFDITASEQYSTVTQYKALSSELSVQSKRISSVVSKQESMIKEYGYADFTIECGWKAGVYVTNHDGTDIGSPIGYEENTGCQLMVLNNVEKGDVIRVVPNTSTQIAIVGIYGCDGDAQGAEQDAFGQIGDDVKNYTWYGRSTTLFHHFDIDVNGSIEYALPVDSREVHIWLSDDWSEKSKVQVFHIKAKISAQSRIDQTADNIRLQVGQAGINLDSKVITLDASKTIVTGDLAVRTVKTYWDAEQTQLKSAYNGNGEGTIVYYYPNGRVMKEDKFVSDTSGNIVGMRTTYYKANGEVAWVIDEGGFLTTLPDYWEVLNNGNKMCYSNSEANMMDILTQYLGESMQHFAKDKFSRFVGKSEQYKNFNGKVSKAVRSSENPTTSMLWAGILIYSVELYKDGARPTYIVTYEVCTTKLGQVGAILTKKFNSLGEVK